MTTILDATLTASKARVSHEVKTLLVGLLKEAIVTVRVYYYTVDFGPDVRPQIHIVNWDGICTCSLGEDCPAVTAVKKHLQDGKEAATQPRPGYWPAIPAKCPVCGGRTYYAPNNSSKHRGVGWGCINDKGHYWGDQAHALVSETNRLRAEGILPPVVAAIPSFGFKDGYNPNL